MSEVAIRVQGLSKLYRIGQREHYYTLRDSLANLFTGFFRRRSVSQAHRGSVSQISNTSIPRLPVSPNDPGTTDPTPQLPVSPTQNGPASPFPRSPVSQETGYIWALQDVSFEVKRGEVVGVIGRNGAGKTTLLKILSRVTEPTEGRATIHGRVGSLLEVGTGFHPELTGRENIYLNAAVLGMRRAEIDQKFDEIVEFSGVEKFIDTPVKRYSSGMQVRLAFSVAAHLDPEILIVDEVLAVGDVEFQKKCLGKMGAVAKAGRTVLLVSHNMAAIRNLCQRTLLLDCGKLVVDAETERTVAEYLHQNSVTEGSVVSWKEFEGRLEGWINRENPSIRLREIALVDRTGLGRNTFRSDEEIRISVTYECLTLVNDLRVVVQIVDEENRAILTTQNVDDSDGIQFYRRESGIYRSSCAIPPNSLGEKRLYLSVHLIYPKVEHLVLNKLLAFDVSFQGYNNVQYGSYKDSFLRPQLRWETQVLAGKQEVTDGR